MCFRNNGLIWFNKEKESQDLLSTYYVQYKTISVVHL